ncbi:MAG TPA: HAMP domain-containing sensor histidine kinase, partial [Marmoricola sp.]|nr:HAMP domain-containing sensor histidine kinase [Marmoricola sp.]
QSIYTRFEVDGSSDEFVALGRTLNRLMDRVTDALHNEQRLTSEVAHELKTPLTVIRAEAELSMLEARDPQVHQRLERIIEQIQTMTHSITALVQIARDQDQQDTATVDEAVASVVDSFAPPDGIHLTPNVVAGGGLLVPRDSLTRSLSPLVDNALKYAKSSVEVQVRTHDGRLLVSVLDDGPGTDGDPFESPTGLGLPLSQRIASAMGGQVSLTQASDPTEITIDIPIGELPTGV